MLFISIDDFKYFKNLWDFESVNFKEKYRTAFNKSQDLGFI